MANVEKMIAETFLEMAQGLESGSYGKRPKIALTGMGSEHGEENAMKAALMAAKDGEMCIRDRCWSTVYTILKNIKSCYGM